MRVCGCALSICSVHTLAPRQSPYALSGPDEPAVLLDLQPPPPTARLPFLSADGAWCVLASSVSVRLHVGVSVCEYCLCTSVRLCRVWVV